MIIHVPHYVAPKPHKQAQRRHLPIHDNAHSGRVTTLYAQLDESPEPYVPFVDPMHTYLSYYRIGYDGFGTYPEISAVKKTYLDYAVRNYSEIETWVDENTTRPVLVQSNPENDEINFCFLDGSDVGARFGGYLQSLYKKHVLELHNVSRDRQEEIECWAREHLGEKWRTYKISRNWNTVTIWHRDENDLLLTTLRWGGADDKKPV